MTYETLLMRIMHRTGLDERRTAEALTHHVLEHLANHLPETTVEMVSKALPEPIANRWLTGRDESPVELDALYHSVAEQFDVDVSFGLEFTQVVCQVLGESIGHKNRQQLRHRLPDSWHPLFEPRQATISPPRRRRDERRTLSSAEPGSARPISEAKPGHRNSIARSDRPQFGTKLSTSHGKAARRTLAEGRPGSSRPISEG